MQLAMLLVIRNTLLLQMWSQMTTPSELCQESQKMMYWYENIEFKLLFLYF